MLAARGLRLGARLGDGSIGEAGLRAGLGSGGPGRLRLSLRSCSRDMSISELSRELLDAAVPGLERRGDASLGVLAALRLGVALGRDRFQPRLRLRTLGVEQREHPLALGHLAGKLRRGALVLGMHGRELRRGPLALGLQRRHLREQRAVAFVALGLDRCEARQRPLALGVRRGGLLLGLPDALAQHVRALDEILEPRSVGRRSVAEAGGGAALGLLGIADGDPLRRHPLPDVLARQRWGGGVANDDQDAREARARLGLGAGDADAARRPPARARDAAAAPRGATYRRRASAVAEQRRELPAHSSGTETTTNRSERGAPPAVVVANACRVSSRSPCSRRSKAARCAGSVAAASTSVTGRPASCSADAPSSATTPTPHSASAPSGVLRT